MSRRSRPAEPRSAWARSIISSEVTHARATGAVNQVRCLGGITLSIPYLTMVWVWPPQTSMMHPRPGQRCAAMASAGISSPRPGVPIFIEVFHGAGTFNSSSWFILSRNSNTTRSASFSSIFDSRESDVNQHILPHIRIGDMFETDLLGHTTEIDFPHQHVVLMAASLHDFTRNA